MSGMEKPNLAISPGCSLVLTPFSIKTLLRENNLFLSVPAQKEKKKSSQEAFLLCHLEGCCQLPCTYGTALSTLG